MKLVGGTEFKDYFNQDVIFFKVFHLMLVKKNRHTGEHKKRTASRKIPIQVYHFRLP